MRVRTVVEFIHMKKIFILCLSFIGGIIPINNAYAQQIPFEVIYMPVFLTTFGVLVGLPLIFLLIALYFLVRRFRVKSKRKKLLYVGLFLVSLAIVSILTLSSLYYSNSWEFWHSGEKYYSADENESNYSDEFDPINKDFKYYKNYDLGFSLQYPTKNYYDFGEVPVVVTSDSRRGISYDDIFHFTIFEPWILDSNNELIMGAGPDDIQNNKVKNWKIVVANVPTTQDLLNFIQEQYYDGCGISEIKPSKVDGISDVILATTGPDAADSISCFINYGYVIKYSADKGKVASWSLGQDATFFDANLTPIDSKIVDNFRFMD